MLSYTLTTIQDVYYITNTGTETITYTLTLVDVCTTTRTEIATGSILAGGQEIVPFTTDGNYELLLQDTDILNDTLLYIKYYLTFQTSLIQDVFDSLCGCDCGCKDCTHITEDCLGLLTTNNRMEVFKYLALPRYQAAFNAAHATTYCTIIPETYCGLNYEIVAGTPDFNVTLAKQLLATNYLAMYFADLKDVTDTAEIAYIKEKYQATAILCCINAIGINIKAVEAAINTGSAIIVNSGVYTSLPPTVGDIIENIPNQSTFQFTETTFNDVFTPDPNVPSLTLQAVRFPTLSTDGLDGVLTLNSVPVNDGQVITMPELLVGTGLVYTSPNQITADIDDWNFQLQDSAGNWSL